MNATEIYLNKTLKLILPESTGANSALLAATIGKNLENLGYGLSEELFVRLASLSKEQLEATYKQIVPILKKMRGAHRKFKPMYPNFPKQVIEASDCELYFNAMVHYWSFHLLDAGVINETWLPKYEKEERLPLTEKVKLDIIDLGSEEDFMSIFTNLIGSRTSISESDKQIVEWFVQTYKNSITEYLPEEIPFKEQLCFAAALFTKYTDKTEYLTKYMKTTTDILRVSVALSGGDISLATNTKFIKFKRGMRKNILRWLESTHCSKEEMVKYRHEWIRLGEILHPGEYRNRFPKAYKAFKALRNDKIPTFNTQVEESLILEDTETTVALLMNKPGEFARRLDHILRVTPFAKQPHVATYFESVADQVATPLLLQVVSHLTHRPNLSKRPIFPKGNLAKLKVVPYNSNWKLAKDVRISLIHSIQQTLVKRFSELEPLGKVYVGDELKNYLVPFSQRSASKAFKTIVRGSRVPFDPNAKVIRFFIWWKNAQSDNSWYDRTDIDLSATLYDDKWNHHSDVAFYNLRESGCTHSGDITDAPNGAAEFIDAEISTLRKQGVRYVAMCIGGYTPQPFCDLPECFAGFMTREERQSGEIFEPKTVRNKFDLTSNSRLAMPLVIDLEEKNVIWCDMTITERARWNTVRGNGNSIATVAEAMSNVKKPTLYDLFMLHAEARGELVLDKSKADTIFSADEGITPMDNDMIASKFL